MPRLSQFAAQIGLTPLQTALAAASRPDVLSFAMGLPDPRFFPAAEMAEASQRVIVANIGFAIYAAV